MHAWLLHQGLTVCVAATKADKIARSRISQHVDQIRRILATPWPVVAVSAEQRQGLEDIWTLIEADLATVRMTTGAAPTNEVPPS
jgi:GTP-binding protein